MLAVRDLETAYGPSQVLFGVNLEVGTSQVVSLLGRNGMGKTTTVRSIMGIARPKAGHITFDGKAMNGLPSYRIAQAGLGLVPEGRQVFPNLTVRENLLATARKGPWTLERVLNLFRNLRERQGHYGNQLSGGEQQMLAIGRALMGNPSLLLMDEPLEGLAPIIVEGLLKALKKLIAEDSLAVVLVEQHAKLALQVTQSAMVLNRGRVIHSGSSAELLADPKRLAALVLTQ